MERLMILTILCAASIPLAAASQARDGDLRLNGHGASRFSGRLEIFYNGEWGTVCAAADALFLDFDYKAGSVACRQMGLGNVVDVYTIHNLPELRFRYGEGSGPIFLDKVQCDGHESHLLRCNYNVPFGRVSDSSPCSHTTEVAITCSNISTPYHGEVRLRSLNPSTFERRGIVEFYSTAHAQWAPVCSSREQSRAAQLANVTCKQLGYTGYVDFSFYDISGPHWNISSALACTGSESCLRDCLPSLPVSMATGGCTAMLLQCEFDTTLASSVQSGSYHTCPGEPTNHERAVRLTSSNNFGISDEQPIGIVEVFVNGAWGPVCHHGDSSILEADVVCKQLAFSAAARHRCDLFHEVAENQIMYNLDCTGLEMTIQDCSVTETTECISGHLEAECNNDIPPYGSLALRDASGRSGSRGTLLVHTGKFQPVCDSNFDETLGEVACRQLGYTRLEGIHLATSYSAVSYPDKDNRLLVARASCSSQSQYLLSCLNNTLPAPPAPPECREGLDEVVISCYGGGPEANVRLVGDDAPMSGRLEVYIHDQWGSVCAGDGKFGYLEASIVCRSLNYKGVARGPFHVERPVGMRNHLDSVVCSGFEGSIFDCQHMLGGDNCSSIVGIECSNSSGIHDGELRLNGNESVMNETDALGRLEIAYHGVWMTVCGAFFSPEAAQVACRQLKYTTVVDVCRNSSCYGEGNGSIYMAEDMCSGEESRLLDCNREPRISQPCDHSLDVGLQCERYITPTTPSVTTGSVAPAPFPSLYIYIIIAVSAFLLVVGFVVAVCCCACCVHKRKNAKKEGTWISPNQRNGGVGLSSGSSGTAANTYIETSIRNNLHSSDLELSKKARDQYDDPSDTVPSKRDASLLSPSPSNYDEPPSSPVGKVSSPDNNSSSSPMPRKQQRHVYQNVTEIRCTVEEPPPNYDELDDFPPVHDYRVPNSVSFSATNALSEEDEVGDGSGFAECTMDSGIGSTTHESDMKRDLQLPPLSPDDHETML